MTNNTVLHLRRYFSSFPIDKIPKGTLIYRPGDKIKNISFIKSGYVRLFTKNGDQETSLCLFRPLFILSYTHAFSKHPLNFYVETITDCEIWNVSSGDFKEYLDENKKLADKISAYFLTSLIQIMSNQSSLISGNSQNKVATLLLQLGFDFGTPKENHIHVPFPATHRIISTLIGLTRETTSIQMSKLQKQKVISTKRREFTILNLDELKRLSQLTD